MPPDDSERREPPVPAENRSVFTPPVVALIGTIITALVTLTGIYVNSRINSTPAPSGTPSLTATPNPTPAAVPLAVEITGLRNGQDLPATREAGHDSAHFTVPVTVSGDSGASDLGIYILVRDRGTWEIQREAVAIPAEKGYHEIDAWSGGGSKDNRTPEGQAVQLKAVIASIKAVEKQAPDGSSAVTSMASEVSPVVVSSIVTVKVRPIREIPSNSKP